MSHTAQIITVMFLWAICFPLIVLGLPHAPHLTFAALRAFLAGICLLIPAMIMKRRQPKDFKSWAMLTAIGLGATTLGFFGMFHASEFVSPGIATVIANTQPLMAAVLAALVLKEHLDGKGKIGLLLGFTGIVLIALPSLLSGTGANYALGIFYIILGAVGITLSNVLIRYMAGRIDALSAMGWQLVIGSFFLAIIAFFTEDMSAVTWNTPFIFSLLGLALPGTALAYWLWYRVLGEVELNRANAFSFLVPIFGLVLGAVFFQEKIGALIASGIGLTILGIVLVNWPKGKSDKILPMGGK
jgi:drug/metabolite transporter (DMT)-like permease